MVKKILLVFLFLGVAILGALIWGKQQLNAYLETPRVNEEQLFTLPDGSYFSHLAPQLIAQGLLDNDRWWRVLSKLRPELTHIKSGTYLLPKGASLEELLVIFNEGKAFQFKLTFVEGSTYKDWLNVLAKAKQLKPLEYSEADLLSKLGSKETKIEGLLFPETYHYTANMSAYSVIKKAYLHQQAVVKKLWEKRDPDLPYKTPYEALIMASIIEKESGLSDDRDKIASVFVNRLRIGMRLQTDPTVIYGMGERYDGRIRTKDLRENTAYNTYTIDGLPPTPIAMPSEEALYAALHPAQTKYLYFVSKGDGTSYFSKSLREHNNAVNKYIRGK